MNSRLASLVFAAALGVFSASAVSAGSPPADRAADLLARTGTVPLKQAGPYVEIGTYAIQVAVKLGRPAARLADGTWLYPNFRIEDSAAGGTLVVRFKDRQVSDLALVTSAIATAMMTPDKPQKDLLLAGRK